MKKYLSKYAQYIRQKPFRAALWGIVFFFVFLNPWAPSVFQACCKAKDPDSPFFVPYFFDFADYSDRSQHSDLAIRKIFPEGTDKKYVDLILATIGGAEQSPYTDQQTSILVYSKTPLIAINKDMIFIKFESGKLVGLCTMYQTDKCMKKLKGE